MLEFMSYWRTCFYEKMSYGRTCFIGGHVLRVDIVSILFWLMILHAITASYNLVTH